MFMILESLRKKWNLFLRLLYYIYFQIMHEQRKQQLLALILISDKMYMCLIPCLCLSRYAKGVPDSDDPPELSITQVFTTTNVPVSNENTVNVCNTSHSPLIGKMSKMVAGPYWSNQYNNIIHIFAQTHMNCQTFYILIIHIHIHIHIHIYNTIQQYSSSIKVSLVGLFKENGVLLIIS